MIIQLMRSSANQFLKFIEDVDGFVNMKEAVSQVQGKYCIDTYQILHINSEQAYLHFQMIHEKFYRKEHSNFNNCWFENELRIFVWTLVSYSSLKQVPIEEMNESDWSFFSKIFIHKDPKLFQYQVRALMKEEVKGKLWEKDEEEILRKLIESKSDKSKWNQISKNLYHISDKKYYRSAKQCREHWNNHMDPTKIKGGWRMTECLQMFQFVQQNGKKWAKLSKLLEDRNEHSIKNKFNSLMKKQKKLTKGYQDDEVISIIIKRIENATQRNNGRNRDFSQEDFDFEDFNDKMEPSSKESSIEPVKASTYTEKFRLKLQKLIFQKDEEKILDPAQKIARAETCVQVKTDSDGKESEINTQKELSAEEDEPRLNLDNFGDVEIFEEQVSPGEDFLERPNEFLEV